MLLLASVSARVMSVSYRRTVYVRLRLAHMMAPKPTREAECNSSGGGETWQQKQRSQILLRARVLGRLSRINAHLTGTTGKGVTVCTDAPAPVKVALQAKAVAAQGAKEVKFIL